MPQGGLGKTADIRADRLFAELREDEGFAHGYFFVEGDAAILVGHPVRDRSRQPACARRRSERSVGLVVMHTRGVESGGRRVILAGIIVAVLGIAGCTGGADEGPETTVDEPGDTSPGGFGGGGEDEIDPVACVIGNWVISEFQMQLFYDAFARDVPITYNVRGSTDVTFGDTDYQYRPFFVLEFDLDGVLGSATLNGSITGDYVVDEGVITTNNDDNTVFSQVEVDGVTIDGSDLATDLLAASPINSAPYECRPGPQLIIDMDTGSGRVPILLEPAP